MAYSGIEDEFPPILKPCFYKVTDIWEAMWIKDYKCPECGGKLEDVDENGNHRRCTKCGTLY